jgi:carbonic anhydrase
LQGYHQPESFQAANLPLVFDATTLQVNVAKLETAAPILNKSVEDKRVHVVGAVYNLANGRIKLVT